MDQINAINCMQNIHNYIFMRISYLIIHAYTSSVEENWLAFKQKLSELLDKYVPTKTPNSGKHLPWLNKFIKHKMRGKYYDKARQTHDLGDWENQKLFQLNYKICL